MKRRGQQRKPQGGAASTARPAGPPLLVTIEKPIYGGAFLSRVEGKAMFTPLTLPGEQARVRVVEDRRSYANAEVEEIVAAAPERIAPRCKHFGACGGCDYQHTDYATELAFKQTILRETLERGGLRPGEMTTVAAEPWGYRNRIRVAFDAEGNPGYRGRRSHAVVPIRECPIAAPVLVEAAIAAAEFFKVFGVTHRPAEISLFCNAAGDAMLASVFTRGPATVPLKDYFDGLGREIPALRGVELVEESGSDNPPRTVATSGETWLEYRASGADYRVGHGAFFQVNRWLIDALVERVTGGQAGGLAWDLFAGVGLFARKLAGSFERVVAVESAPGAVEGLETNLNGANAIAEQANAVEFLQRHRNAERPDLIVVDPPRAGLGPEVTALLSEVGAPALTYVSCDPATLARDLIALQAGGYAIREIALVDLFPQTFHLETVVHLDRT